MQLTSYENLTRLNDGLVDLLFQTNSSILRNHLIFSYAFSEFCDKYKQEGVEFRLQTQD